MNPRAEAVSILLLVYSNLYPDLIHQFNTSILFCPDALSSASVVYLVSLR